MAGQQNVKRAALPIYKKYIKEKIAHKKVMRVKMEKNKFYSKKKMEKEQLYPDDLNVVTLCCDRRIIAFCTGNRSQYGMLYILYRFYFMGDFAYFKILSKSCLSKKK